MLTRALIVFLAILNLGVAAWWLLRPAPSVPTPVQPGGVAELQWLPGGDSSAAPAVAASAAPPAAPALTDSKPEELAGANRADSVAVQAATDDSAAAALPLAIAATAAADSSAVDKPAVDQPAAERQATEQHAAEQHAADKRAADKHVADKNAAEPPPRCLALGPFVDRAAATAAQGRARTLLAKAQLREQAAAGADTRFRVLLPAAANREEAQATAKRVVAAGLGDYYVIAQGEDINAVALGQYRNREGAERRMAAVQAAGFKPRLVASGAASQWWLDARLAAGASPAQAQQRSRAPGQQSLDCTGLR